MQILTLTFSPKVTLICFDLSTLAPCTGTNKDLTGTGGSSGYYSAHIMAIDSTRIFAHTDSTLYCYFATNLTLCAGWPKSKSALGGTWPTSKLNKFPLVHTDATGKPDGICLEPGCLDLTGVAKATWPSPWNASSFSSAYPTVPINPDKFDLTMGFSSSWGSRVFFYYPNDWSRNAPFFCWDYATSSECLNFQYTAGSMLYFSRPDPEDPQCIWWASDPGKLGSFNALTGDPCARIVANVNPVSSYTGCSGRQVVVGPKYMTVKSIGGTNGPKNLTLTVLKADGTPVPGWIKVPSELSARESLC